MTHNAALVRRDMTEEISGREEICDLAAKIRFGKRMVGMMILGGSDKKLFVLCKVGLIGMIIISLY